jgi:hypothetical protein
VCPSRVAKQLADELSEDSRHNFTVVSALPVAKNNPCGWNVTDKTQSLCGRVATQFAVEPSGEKRHNFAVLSAELVARRGEVG